MAQAAAASTKETPVTQEVPISAGKLAKMGGKMREFKMERDAAKTALEAAQKELAEYKAKVASPDEQTKELAALKQAARDRTAYDRFAELARERGAKESAIKALWKLAGHQADKDEPDDDALADLIDGLKTEADFAFDAPADADAVARAAAVGKARSGLEIRGDTSRPAGGGRSGRNTGGDGTIITAEMRADPKFMLNPANREIIAQAAREHRFR